MPLNTLGQYLLDHPAAIMARWRGLVRADPASACRRLQLTDTELDNHVPMLLAALVDTLAFQATQQVEAEGAIHGHQRRENGYTITEVLWELTLFRRLLLVVVEEYEGKTGALTQEELAAARERILDVIDRSMKASISQYIQEAEAERDRLQAQLETNSAQKDRFLAMLSHELRNPIAPILSAVQLLKQAALPDPRLARAREIIERQARYQAKLIDDLLDVNRIAHGKVDLQQAVVDLQAAVRHAIESCLPEIKKKGLHLEVHAPDSGLLVFADPTRLAQIMTNLLTNAVKFTPAAGALCLTAALEGEEIVLRVQDTGIGISAEMLPHVFDMFAQADTSLDRATGGLGVGLTVVKNLVEMHGGRITAHSEGLGKGATFVIRLPSVRREDTAAAVTDRRPRKRVGLVEDNPDARAVLADVLETMGIIVLAVQDGEAALRLAAQEKLDAYVVDIGLPGMDGYEVAQSLRELQREPHPLLIALTGYGTAEDKQRAAAAGFDYHMTKPADLEELQRLLSG